MLTGKQKGGKKCQTGLKMGVVAEEVSQVAAVGARTLAVAQRVALVAGGVEVVVEEQGERAR